MSIRGHLRENSASGDALSLSIRGRRNAEEVQNVLVPVPPVAAVTDLVGPELPATAPSPDRAEVRSEEVSDLLVD